MKAVISSGSSSVMKWCLVGPTGAAGPTRVRLVLLHGVVAQVRCSP